MIEATLLRRYKRFLADVRLNDGEELTVHCANPGSMKGLVHPGGRCWISDSRNPKRKLRFSLEQVEADGVRVSVNTARANALVGEALADGVVTAPIRVDDLDAEVRLGASRIDFRGRNADGEEVWIEVKQVTLAEPPLARFPDAKSVRALRHLGELVSVHAPDRGCHAMLVLLVARPDCDRFVPAADIDPDWAAAFHEAFSRGMHVYVARLGIDDAGMSVMKTPGRVLGGCT